MDAIKTEVCTFFKGNFKAITLNTYITSAAPVQRRLSWVDRQENIEVAQTNKHLSRLLIALNWEPIVCNRQSMAIRSKETIKITMVLVCYPFAHNRKLNCKFEKNKRFKPIAILKNKYELIYIVILSKLVRKTNHLQCFFKWTFN